MDLYSLANVLERPRRALHDAAWNRWYARAKGRAAQDAVWADIEARRQVPDNPTLVRFLDDELTWDDWHVQEDIFNRLNPTPWWRHVNWWLDAHGPAAGLREVQDFVQRGSRGFADRDLWSFDWYLDRTIAARVVGAVLVLAATWTRVEGEGLPASAFSRTLLVLLAAARRVSVPVRRFRVGGVAAFGGGVVGALCGVVTSCLFLSRWTVRGCRGGVTGGGRYHWGWVGGVVR